MKMRIVRAAIAAALVVPGSALAAPSPLAPMAASSARDLEAFVARGKAAHPETFRAVAKLREDLPVLARKARSGKVNVRALLVAQGPNALPAILGELRDGPEATPGGWLAPTAISWIIGLLEAAVHFRDPAAIPILEAVARHPKAPVPVVAAAARALGALATDDAEARLEALFAAKPEHRAALGPALGECRRLPMARFLVRTLEGTKGAEAVAVVEGLGQVASAWPWQTPELAARAEGNDVRRLAFDALLARYGSADATLRAALLDALWLVDWPAGPALARAAASKSPAVAEAYEALAKRLEKSPLHR